MMAHNPRTAVLYVSHLVTPETLWNYFRIRQGVPAAYDLYWVYQGSDLPYGLSALPIETFQVSDEVLAQWEPAMRGDSLIPGNLHVLLLTFSRCRTYDRYWFIEYDVQFTDDWGELFDLSRGNEADLVAAFVESPFEDASWSHWDTINLPYSQVARSFNPIHRVSNRVLRRVVDLITNGHWAHNEALLASICQAQDWPMKNLNDLSFDRWGVPLYTPVPNANAIGTLNYRPAASTLWRKKPSRIHHPVKPIRWFIENFGRRQGLIEAFRARPVCQSDAIDIGCEQEERNERPNGSDG